MNPDRLHHVALGIVGLALGTNGAVAVSATGGSDLGGAVTLVGAACLVGLSAHGLVSGADRTVDERVAYLSVFAALLSVAGTGLTLVD